MGCMTSNNWLDFRDDPDQHADTGFLHGIFTNTSGEIFTNYAGNSSRSQRILTNFFERRDVSSAKTFNFGADLNYDTDPEFFARIFTVVGQG